MPTIAQLKRYQLAMPVLLDQALYVYTLGLSIRDLQETLYVLFGHALSREAVNRVTRAARSPMQAWRRRRITDTPPILIIDGVWGQVLFPNYLRPVHGANCRAPFGLRQDRQDCKNLGGPGVLAVKAKL